MDTRIQAALKILENDYPTRLTVKGVAARVGLSRSHLEFLFKKETGRTLKAYLRQVRLNRAAELLIENHGSIKQVAYAVGYRYLPNFNRDFKLHFGKTPSEWRRGSADVGAIIRPAFWLENIGVLQLP